MIPALSILNAVPVLPEVIAKAVIAFPSGSTAVTVPMISLLAASSGTLSVAAVTRGASFTAVTVKTNVSVAVAPLEAVAVTVIVVVPNLSASGIN